MTWELPPPSWFLTGRVTYRSLRQQSWLMYVHALRRTSWDGEPKYLCSACTVWLSPGSVDQITEHVNSTGHKKNLRVLRERHVNDDETTARALPMKSKKAKPVRKRARALPMKSRTALKKPARNQISALPSMSAKKRKAD
jgi:hypothetical protein